MARHAFVVLVSLFSVTWTLTKSCDPSACGLSFQTLYNDTSVDGLCKNLGDALPCLEKCLEKAEEAPQVAILRKLVRVVKKVCATPQSKQYVDSARCIIENYGKISGCIFSGDGIDFHGFTGEGGKATFCCTADKKAHCIIRTIQSSCSARASGGIAGAFRSSLQPLINRKCSQYMPLCSSKADWNDNFPTPPPNVPEPLQKLKSRREPRIEDTTVGTEEILSPEEPEKMDVTRTVEANSVAAPQEWVLAQKMSKDGDNGSHQFCASFIVLIIATAGSLFKLL